MKRHIVERLLFFYKFFTISTPVLAVIIISTMTMNHPGGQITPLGTALATLDFAPTEQINTPIAGDIAKKSSENPSQKSEQSKETEKTQETTQEEPSQNSPENTPQIIPQIAPQTTTSQNTTPQTASKVITKTVQTSQKSPKSTPIDYNKIHLDDQGHPIEYVPVTPSIDNDSFPDMTEDACNCPPTAPEAPESPEEPEGPENPEIPEDPKEDIPDNQE